MGLLGRDFDAVDVCTAEYVIRGDGGGNRLNLLSADRGGSVRWGVCGLSVGPAQLRSSLGRLSDVPCSSPARYCYRWCHMLRSYSSYSRTFYFVLSSSLFPLHTKLNPSASTSHPPPPLPHTPMDFMS